MKVTYDYFFGAGGVFPIFQKRSRASDLLDACRELARCYERLSKASSRFQRASGDAERAVQMKLTEQAIEDIDRAKVRIEDLGGDLSTIDETLEVSPEGDNGDD